ncbi:hypothetical protein FOZ63_023056, partial [Perkinsus olseni]
FGQEEHQVPVDTGCDCSLISAQFVEKEGIPVETSTGSVSFRLMDSSATMKSHGIVKIGVEYLSTNGWVHVTQSFHVVKNTALGPVVLGNDFAALHCQGMTWDEHGQITVAAHGCVRGEGEEVEEVKTYGLPNLPGVKVYEYADGKVEIVSSDFYLWREP